MKNCSNCEFADVHKEHVDCKKKLKSEGKVIKIDISVAECECHARDNKEYNYRFDVLCDSIEKSYLDGLRKFGE